MPKEDETGQPTPRQAEGNAAVETARREELEQIRERIEKLDALSQSFARGLNQSKHSESGHKEPGPEEFYNYSRLVQQQVEAVLMYQKVAGHWTDADKQKVKELLDKAITSHNYLTEVLEEQCKSLAQKMDNTELALRKKTPQYYSSHSQNGDCTGWMFDMEG
ncbi:hypothetical protein P0082_01165 [Candidatus Haliotispira prima]|uniref:Uncharacterized protein n=1 Tax=Candidatus Haliotispira prima TaxID=3034016 RepID=A0ABY8MHN7_9SPIO|nr:hypothetical protein P0082_01165 [Candidatus Haliotispira prima]